MPTKGTPLYTFTPDATPEFQKRVEDFASGALKSLQAKLVKNALGDQVTVPFASVREGDKISISVPLTMSRGDQLAELIMLVASKVPSAVLQECTTGWVEPQWTSESSRHLMGIVSAIQGPPDSFSVSSSPVDLMRAALWITAANSAIANPGKSEKAHGSVVPTEVGGSRSASKYLTKAFGALRAISSEPASQAAVATLERLLKLWIKDQSKPALALVRKCKIQWGTVLHRGAPTETKKVKGTTIINVTQPIKPSRSPFLSEKEKQMLASLFAPAWNAPEELRKAWVQLPPTEQHDQYGTYVKEVTKAFDNIKKISSSVHSKLGHRKRWIHQALTNKGMAPSKKKDKSNEFMWATAFWKLNLEGINLSVALVFSPSHYLVDPKYDCDTILTTLWNKDEVLTPDDATDQVCGVTVGLWKEWAMRFAPDFTKDSADVPQAETLRDDNPFSALSSTGDGDDEET
jgi:hypothetical protein